MQNIKLTKSQFELIAHTIRTLPIGGKPEYDSEHREAIAEHFANRLGSTNPNFKRERFIEWCTTRPLNKFSTFVE